MAKPKQIKRVAIYTRCSTVEQMDNVEFHTLASQEETCRTSAEIKLNGAFNYEITEVFADGGYSGGDTNRPALKGLLEKIEMGMIDVVLVYKLDRLSRSV